MLKFVKVMLVAALVFVGHGAHSADKYMIDVPGMHAFVQFRVKHLGYSWLYGRFNRFEGEFTYDEKDPSKNSIFIEVDVGSLDSNHAERDSKNHVLGPDFLNVDKYKKATFKSTRYKKLAGNKAELTGDLTFMGVTKPITIDVEHIGGGPDPWGGYRQGFEGRATIKPVDFGWDITKKLGPAAGEVELLLSVEGIRQKKK